MGLSKAIKTAKTVVKEIRDTERNGTGPEVKPAGGTGVRSKTKVTK